MKKVGLCATAAGCTPTEARLRVDITAYLPDKRRRDKDNISKSIYDAMNGIAYVDDDQITDGETLKRYDKENPRAEITIVELMDDI